jgi:hypothetical protein
MPFPQTEPELKAAGYRYSNTGRCRGCGAMIAWYHTPTGKTIPLDDATFEPHWATCPKADEFRRKE